MAARRGGGVEEGCPALSLATAEFLAAGAEKPIYRRVGGRFLELLYAASHLSVATSGAWTSGPGRATTGLEDPIFLKTAANDDRE